MSNVTSISEARKSRSWNRMRWEWQRCVLACADLPDRSKLLACVLVSQFAHHESAECRPGLEALAEALATSGDTVKRALRGLEDAGWIARGAGRGRGNHLSISFLFPPSEKGADLHSFEDGKGGNPAPLSAREKGADLRGKGCRSASPPRPPYKAEPNLNQKARAEKPRSHLACSIAENGAENLAWDAWLEARGHPPLGRLGAGLRTAGCDGFEVPFRYPPDTEVGVRISEKWVAWAASVEQG